MIIPLWCVAICTVLYSLLAWRDRVAAVCIVAALLPTYVLRFQIAGIPFTFLEMMIVVVVGAWVIELIQKPQNPCRLLTPIQWGSVAVFFVAAVFAVWVAPELRTALGLFKAYLIEPVGLALVCLGTLQTRAHWQRLGHAVLAGGIVIAIIAIVQYLTGWGIPDPWQVWPDRRSTAVYGYPNAVGLYLAPLVVYAIGQLLSPLTTSRQRWILAGCALLMSVSVIAAQADGGVIAIMAGSFVLLQFTPWRRWTWLLAALGLIGVLLWSPTRQVILFHDVSGTVRLVLWHGTINLLQHHPLHGAGLGGFPQLYDVYRLPSHTELLVYPHNLWLDMWVELGLLGLVWLVAWTAAGARLFLQLFQRPAMIDPTAIILIGVWTALLVYGLVDVVYFKNDLAALWWIWTAWTIKVFKDARQDSKNEVH